MGLDMYLTKRTYVGNKYRKPKQMVKVVIPKDQDGVVFPTRGIKTNRINTITESVGYWRKANQVHKWFVDNVQEGVDDFTNTAVAEELLPTAQGFFFGGDNYDKWYLKDLEDTVAICEQAIKEGGDFYYNSSW